MEPDGGSRGYKIPECKPIKSPAGDALERLAMNKTLTKADIVEAIYEKTGANRFDAKQAIDKLLTIMKSAIKKDHVLLISGFGKFECYEKASRKGRNPQTEEIITLPSRKVIVFRLSRKFRAELNPDK